MTDFGGGNYFPGPRLTWYPNNYGTQSGVSDNFAMRVTLYLDFGNGKGRWRLGPATVVGNSSVDVPNIKLPEAPRKAALAALDDVLALSIENVKK